MEDRVSAIAPPVRSGKGRGLWTDAAYRLARNKLAVAGASIILIMALAAIFAPIVAPKGYAVGSLKDNYASPGSDYLLGADFMGRDMLSRIIYGTRVSLTAGVVGATIATMIGLVYGSVAGYYGGRTDNWMMRIVDILYGLPTLLVIILIMVYFRSASLSGEGTNFFISWIGSIDDSMGGMFFIFVGIGLTSWLTASRLVRVQILSLKEQQFIESAHAIGSSDMRIMTRHLLPNVLGPLIVAETLTIPTYILYEAFLSFIGLGVNPPMPSWGGMISEGFRGMRSYPHLVLYPAGALTVTLLAFNFLGDGLRDALDPRMLGTS
jgi:oligopeptide transport system permease protein